MFPTLVEFGFLKIHSYGLCMALGLLCAVNLVAWLARREEVDGMGDEGFASNMFLALAASSIIGARAAYVMEHWSSTYAQNPISAFKPGDGGLMFYGGFLLSFATVLVFAHVKKIKIPPLLDILATALPLGHAFGRLGCFLSGCCFGRPTDAWYGVVYPVDSHAHLYFGGCPVIPSQLVESGLNLIVFAMLITISLRVKTRPGIRTGIYMMCYAILRSFVETLRGDTRMNVGVFSIAQFISLGVFTAGAAFVVNAIWRKNVPEK
ncbi:MAG: prolipoprotein diacylglyceryl transferase [Kiritimatiellaeota bacterium]|nr:prolipoprotein diacylglyceryl transferase [Kiritimatiellota bacterium]